MLNGTANMSDTIMWDLNSTASTTSAHYQIDNSEELLLVLEYVSPGVSIVLGTAGLIFNVINTQVFTKQGVKDCVTICLLSLSLTDNGSLCCGLMAAGCRIFKAMTVSGGETTFFVDPMSVWLLLVQGQFCFYDLSTYTTAFIAIERCLCVMMPFKFKSIFTLRNSLFILLSLYAGTFFLHVFLFAYTEFRTLYNPKFNMSQSFIYYSPLRLLLEKYLQIINHLCLPCFALLVILITTVVMIKGLIKSNNFMKKCVAQTSPKAADLQEVAEQEGAISSENPTTDTVNHKHIRDKHPKNGHTSIRIKSKEDYKGVSARTMRVAKMVYILAIICFLCDALRFTIMTSFYADAEMRQGGSKVLAFNVLCALVFLVQIVNCSVNVIVYLTCNQSYRQIFFSLFVLQSKKPKTSYQLGSCRSHSLVTRQAKRNCNRS
ncbi:chemosensory receptor C [Biomphalaria glabrata]|nr:chemosensory receptor C [Biomphalaria glabrata]